MSSTNDFWRRKREIHWGRSDYKCHYCHRFTHPDERSLDHIVPKAFGGPGEDWNLVPACKDCNNRWANAAGKCDCLRCKKALNRFHNMRKKIGDGPIRWDRKDVSDDAVVTELLRRIARAERALVRIEDYESPDAIALRGKVRGMFEAVVLLSKATRLEPETAEKAARLIAFGGNARLTSTIAEWVSEEALPRLREAGS